MKNINLNSDIGEGFGVYDIGNDTEMLKIVNSANIACGFHAGDPNVMDRVVKQSIKNGVSIGAHPGLVLKIVLLKLSVNASSKVLP